MSSVLRKAAEQALAAMETVFMPFHPAVITLRAALAEPEQEPLTDEEMKRVCAETWSFDPYEIARAIEEAHGIIP